jgi:5-methylthioadenosine/S-adenosylhomocysteine deaminase
MRHQRNDDSKASANSEIHGSDKSGDGTSRRAFLKSGAGLLAGGAAASEVLPGLASAQTAVSGDPDLARLQQQPRILIKGGVVLTVDPQVGDFAQADVLIENGKIREVRPNISASADTAAVVDATNRIVIPGFIDTHSHSYQGLLRNVLVNALLVPDYNRDIQTTLTPVYQPSDAYAGELVTALGMINMGTTSLVDISQVSHTPEHTDACIGALRESGIRAVFAFHRGAGPAAQYPQDIRRLKQTYFSSKDQLLTLALATTIDPKMYVLAREVDVPAVQHIVGKDLGPPLAAIGRPGLMRPGDEFIHCLGINDEAWRMIKDTGGHVSICALIDMVMGHGVPVIQDALDYGFRPSLSSDHGTAHAQDMFSVMRATYSLQRMQILQRQHNGEQNTPPLLNCRDMLEFATICGARCANIESKAGSLTPGKDADIVLLRADELSVWPLHNAPTTVVNMMNPSHVETVFIAGKVKKWRGNLVGVDTDRVRRLAKEASDGVMRRANFKLDILA